MNEDRKGKNTILIVGDWVVDENWFLVRHHSDISSHTGLVHYRLAYDKTDIVFSLGGAGNVARVLYQLRYEKNENYQLMGLGNGMRMIRNFSDI
jgi:bifunctional ADP-heptose synthase (sugar kinase/adenylyltransferase)